MSNIKEHFDNIADSYDFYKQKNWYYYQSLKDLYKSLIPPGKKVLEVGCGTGDILASLNPVYGLGTDISEKMIEIANGKNKGNKNLQFLSGNDEDRISELADKNFEYIFMADVIEHLENPEAKIKAVAKILNQKAKFIITMANPLWEPILLVLEKLKLKMPEGPHNRISVKKLRTILQNSNIKIIQETERLIFPAHIPFISDYLNKYFQRIPIIKNFGLIVLLVCQKPQK